MRQNTKIAEYDRRTYADLEAQRRRDRVPGRLLIFTRTEPKPSVMIFKALASA
jgi:hypothetical protein